MRGVVWVTPLPRSFVPESTMLNTPALSVMKNPATGPLVCEMLIVKTSIWPGFSVLRFGVIDTDGVCPPL